MSAWSKAEKNLSDIRQVDSVCDRKAATLKTSLANALPDFGMYGKIFNVEESTAETLARAVRKNDEFSRIAEQSFIKRAKECSELKYDVTNAVSIMEGKILRARQWCERQGLTLD